MAEYRPSIGDCVIVHHTAERRRSKYRIDRIPTVFDGKRAVVIGHAERCRGYDWRIRYDADQDTVAGWEHWTRAEDLEPAQLSSNHGGEGTDA